MRGEGFGVEVGGRGGIWRLSRWGRRGVTCLEFEYGRDNCFT